jgi:iron(III) transport system substrate-binding protein
MVPTTQREKKMLKHLLASSAMALIALTLSGNGALAQPLTVYSPQGEENVAWIKEQAKAAGHDIDVLRAGGGELEARLIAEKNNSQADVVLGLNDITMSKLKAEGLFQKYEPKWAEGLPAQFSDGEGYIYKFWQTPIVIAYDAAKLGAADAPKSWLELTSEKYKGKYVIGPTKWGTTRIVLAGMLTRFADENGKVSDDGWKFMKDFYANAMVVTTGDERVAALTKGDATISLDWFGGAFKEAKQAGYEPTLVNSDGGTPIVSEGVAIITTTDQIDQAKAFIDWFGSPEFMAAYAVKFGQMPAHPKAIEMSPEEVKKNTTLVSAQPMNWDVIAKNLDGWLQQVELGIK